MGASDQQGARITLEHPAQLVEATFCAGVPRQILTFQRERDYRAGQFSPGLRTAADAAPATLSARWSPYHVQPETGPVPDIFAIRTPALFSKRNLLPHAPSGVHLQHDWASGREVWEVAHRSGGWRPSRDPCYAIRVLAPAGNPHLAPLPRPRTFLPRISSPRYTRVGRESSIEGSELSFSLRDCHC